MHRLAIALLAMPLVAAAPAPAVRIAPLEAHFFLEGSGEWTKNLLDSKGVFSGWNTGAGDGDIPAPSTDVIILATFTSPGNGEDLFLERPVTMTARVGKKVIASRKATFVDIPPGGASHQFLALHEIQCAGVIDITVAYGSQSRKAQLRMDCGE